MMDDCGKDERRICDARLCELFLDLVDRELDALMFTDIVTFFLQNLSLMDAVACLLKKS